MSIEPGMILSINQKFWPEKSANIVQAMITAKDGDFFEMCPVHCEIEAAGFFDLIVRGSTIESGMDMVIMCRDSAIYPAAAIDTSPDEFNMGPALTPTESAAILADMRKVLLNQDGKEAYNVLRGMPLTADSAEKKLAESIRNDWHSFRLAAMCGAIREKQADLPGYLKMQEFLKLAAQILEGLIAPLSELNLTPTMASGANLKLKNEDTRQLKELKQSLIKEKPANSSEQEKLQKLLSGENLADLLEATLRLFRNKKRRI
ncbi:MAG: hypothetical protein AB1403_10795 [Candidatus Riflebacteria bacterium]